MPNGSSKDYDFSQKNHWRRTQWNQILSRTKGRERTEPILYLAGPDDNDRKVAVHKGVPSHNLIAIDRSADNVARVKSDGNAAIQADAVATIRSWPTHRRVCAVLLDFCSGLEERYRLDLREPLARTPFAGAAILINLQRGRDASSNVWRDSIQSTPFMRVLRHFPEYVRFTSIHADDDKNRAAIWMTTYAGELAQGACRTLGMDVNNVGGKAQVQIFKNLLSILRPSFHSYESKSGSRTVIFDSVVFTQFRTSDGSGIQTEIEDQFDYGRDPRLSRRISAMLAVRTSRIRGHL